MKDDDEVCRCEVDLSTGKLARDPDCRFKHVEPPAPEVPMQGQSIKNVLKMGRVIQ